MSSEPKSVSCHTFLFLWHAFWFQCHPFWIIWHVFYPTGHCIKTFVALLLIELIIGVHLYPNIPFQWLILTIIRRCYTNTKIVINLGIWKYNQYGNIFVMLLYFKSWANLKTEALLYLFSIWCFPLLISCLSVSVLAR